MKSKAIRNTSYLIVGYKGADLLGKANEIASSILMCSEEKLRSHPDYMYFGFCEDDKYIGVDRAKEIIDQIIDFSCLTAAYDMKVVVIDHMEKMTVDAQNKLLKTIEEANVVIIALAYDDCIISTLKSRMRMMRIDSADRILPKDVSSILDRVRDCLINQKTLDCSRLLSLLGLVKEKDPHSFFMEYREYVPELIDVLGRTLADRQVASKNRDYSGVLSALCQERTICTNTRYSKDDFFELIVTVIENI